MTPAEIAVDRYVSAFASNDPAARRSLIEACWAEDGVVFVGDQQIVGCEALLEHIAVFRGRCPEDLPVMAGGVTLVQQWFRFTAHIERPDGSTYSHLEDVGELRPDGRIARIVTFPLGQSETRIG